MTVKFSCFEKDYPFFEQLLFQQQYSERPEVDTVHLNILNDAKDDIKETKVYYIQEVEYFNNRSFFTYVNID